jgi:hypothetical protein
MGIALFFCGALQFRLQGVERQHRMQEQPEVLAVADRAETANLAGVMRCWKFSSEVS